MSKDNEEVEKTGLIAKKDNYQIEIKYSPEATEKKLMRFTTKSGDQFEISADEMINILTTQVNTETLAPTFVDSEIVNVVHVERHLHFVAKEDIPKGTKSVIPYTHPYPLEFAILEEVYGIAKIDKEAGVMELKKELIDEIKAKMESKHKEIDRFTRAFYKSRKNIDLDKKS